MISARLLVRAVQFTACFAFIGLFVFLPAAMAQGTAGGATVSGTVTDQAGAAIAGAQVSLTSEERGARREAVTNSSGIYMFPDISPGLYDLRISKEGFESYQVNAIRVEVGQRATLNAQLNIGSITNVVTVTGEAVLLETESNAIGTVVDSARINELPLNGRNFLQLALLAAGVAPASGRTALSQIGHPGRSAVIGGVNPATNGYMINGIAVRGSRLGELAVNLSVANIDQFKVQQNFFMPDQGPNPAIVNVTTRSGTNEFHGQAFEFVRNTKLDARNFFAPSAENLKRNQFGFTVGGPIVHNRVWFYGGYEGLREVSAFTSGAYTPTARMFAGDFSEVPQVIYDPDTFSPETGMRSPFPGNIIPQGRINATNKTLLQYYIPGSSLTQRPNNLFVNPRDTQDEDQFNFRIDGSLTPMQSLFGQFIYSKGDAIQGGLFPLSGASYPNEMQLGMVQHTYSVSPTIVNTLRLGFSRNVSLFSNEARESGDLLTPLGISNTFDVHGLGGHGIQGFNGFGRSNGDLGNLDNNYQLDEGLHWVKGKHQFQFGSSIRYRRTWQQNSNATAHGSYTYQSTFTAQLAPDAQGRLVPRANSGNPFADFLLGLPTQAAVIGLPKLPYRFTQYMPYFQDTWKIAPSLTLNYGLSWFKDTLPDPQKFGRNFPHGFDEQTGLLRFAALGEIDPKIRKPQNNDFAPRLGIAWQVTPNTVVRAGAGVYYADQAIIEAQFAAVGPPFNTTVQANNGQLNPIPQYVMGRNIFPPTPLPPLDENFARSLPQGISFFTFNEDSPTPYVSQWNLSVQRTFGASDLVEFAYTGNSAHRQQNRYDLNQCIVAADLSCNNANRPFPRYGPMLTTDFNGNSSYNAFLAKYQHRVTGGLDVRFEYTWAKALTDGWEIQAATNSQITGCRSCDKDHASFDVRHRGVVSFIWDVPYGRGRIFGSNVSRAVDLILGGWNIASVGTFSTGTPIVLSGPNSTGSPFVDHRPNRTCSGTPDSRDLRRDFQWFDTSCFSAPRPGFFGNSSRAPLHGPGVNNWDIGIQKFFSFTETKRLQFRTELFNAFNHTQFGNPNGNSGAANFGLVSSAGAPRLIQLALRLIF